MRRGLGQGVEGAPVGRVTPTRKGREGQTGASTVKTMCTSGREGWPARGLLDLGVGGVLTAPYKGPRVKCGREGVHGRVHPPPATGYRWPASGLGSDAEDSFFGTGGGEKHATCHAWRRQWNRGSGGRAPTSSSANARGANRSELTSRILCVFCGGTRGVNLGSQCSDASATSQRQQVSRREAATPSQRPDLLHSRIARGCSPSRYTPHTHTHWT